MYYNNVHEPDYCMARHAKYAVRQTAVAISPRSSLKLLDFTLIDQSRSHN